MDDWAVELVKQTGAFITHAPLPSPILPNRSAQQSSSIHRASSQQASTSAPSASTTLSVSTSSSASEEEDTRVARTYITLPSSQLKAAPLTAPRGAGQLYSINRYSVNGPIIVPVLSGRSMGHEVISSIKKEKQRVAHRQRTLTLWRLLRLSVGAARLRRNRLQFRADLSIVRAYLERHSGVKTRRDLEEWDATHGEGGEEGGGDGSGEGKGGEDGSSVDVVDAIIQRQDASSNQSNKLRAKKVALTMYSITEAAVRVKSEGTWVRTEKDQDAQKEKRHFQPLFPMARVNQEEEQNEGGRDGGSGEGGSWDESNDFRLKDPADEAIARSLSLTNKVVMDDEGIAMRVRGDTAIAVTNCVLLTLSFFAFDSIELRHRQAQAQSAIAFLSTIPWLSGFSHEHLRRLHAVAVPQTFAPGECIWEQGSYADSLAFVISGSVTLSRVVQVTDSARWPLGKDQWEVQESYRRVPIPVKTVHERQFFGEEALLKCLRRDYTVYAAAPGVEAKDHGFLTSTATSSSSSATSSSSTVAASLGGRDGHSRTKPSGGSASSGANTNNNGGNAGGGVTVIFLRRRHLHYLQSEVARITVHTEHERMLSAIKVQKHLAATYPQSHRKVPIPVCLWARRDEEAPAAAMHYTAGSPLNMHRTPTLHHLDSGCVYIRHNIPDSEVSLRPVESNHRVRAEDDGDDDDPFMPNFAPPANKASTSAAGTTENTSATGPPSETGQHPTDLSLGSQQQQRSKSPTHLGNAVGTGSVSGGVAGASSNAREQPRIIPTSTRVSKGVLVTKYTLG